MENNPAIKTLPAPQTKGSMSLEEAISKRRSVRNFKKGTVSDKDLSQLLFAASGISCKKQKHRTAPSAGATFPMELYVADANGVFKYLVENHQLEKLADKDIREQLSASALGQSCVAQAAVNIIIVGMYERTTQRYGERGIQYVHTEAGHIAQNIHLQAVALGYGSVPVGAFSEEKIGSLLNLSSKEKVLYIIPVGLLP